ncbi:hypothetical protein [Burkholderia sp. BCC0405]|uniref:hypothetical protein n=1 Tax=Burkholderia sp. BCC0405 TaxID=2676298 RepID=UPI00158D87CE|nr:hypothetical protein [Burkholderia sp. BCC0405]
MHIGVIDIPYSNAEQPEKVPQAKKGKANKPIKPKNEAATKTTGDIAEILEDKYGVMQAFVDVKLSKIAESLEESLAGALETVMMGGRPPANPFASAESKVSQMFKDFLGTGEVEHVGIEGTPTQAALDGVNHRLKHPYAKGNPRRPSFIDTSLYQQSATVWIE